MNKHKLEYNLAIISLCVLSAMIFSALVGILARSTVLFSIGVIGLVTLTPTLVILKIRLTYK